MQTRRTSKNASTSGFTLVEAVLAIALLAMGVVSLLVIRGRAVEGARKTRLYQAAQRLAYDLAGQIEAGVFGEPLVGDWQMGIFIDNRQRYTLSRENRGRTTYPAYPENEAEPCYPPGLKFEWEVTEEGQPAEHIPYQLRESDRETYDRLVERRELRDNQQRDLDYLSPDSSSSLPGEEAPPETPEETLEEDEEKTEEVRTLTVFVRMDTADQKDVLLFELQREFIWTYPDRLPNIGEEEALAGEEGGR